MPMYDFRCLLCERTHEALRRIADTNPACPFCGHATVKFLSKAPGVIADSVPGGLVVENLDAQPMRFDSKSDYKRELERRGLEQKVRHIGAPGSDKSPITTRWTAVPVPAVPAPDPVAAPVATAAPQPLVTSHPMIEAAKPKGLSGAVVAEIYRELGGL